MKDIIVVERCIKEEQWVRFSAATSAGRSHLEPGSTWTPLTILLCLFLALKNTLTLTLLGERQMARFKGTWTKLSWDYSNRQQNLCRDALPTEWRKGWAELEKNKSRINAEIPIPTDQPVSCKQGLGMETTPLPELSGEWIFILTVPFIHHRLSTWAVENGTFSLS